MKQVNLTSDYIKDGLLKVDLSKNIGKYYIISDEINIPVDGIKFPQNSVLDFRGGSFMYGLVAVSPQSSIIKPIDRTPLIDLNGSTVYAPIYCIFYSSVKIRGFANSIVHAEWFNDNSPNEGDEKFINRAINAAYGCPVTLEHRTYTLRGSIKFPTLEYGESPIFNSHHTSQTLISPGVLQLAESLVSPDDMDKAAIEVGTHNVILKINQIKGYKAFRNTTDAKKSSCGAGIRLTGCNYHLNIDVQELIYLHKGFDFIPTYNSTIHGTNTDIGIQYCRIEFQYIDATTGIYIDVYSGSGPQYSANTWFNENRILGGQLLGTNGIIFKDRPEELNGGAKRLDGLIFENIGFEKLTGTPLRISNVVASKFLYLRMMESLPENAPWIELKEVAFSDIVLKGQINPDRIKIDHFIGSGPNTMNGDNVCRGVTIRSWLQDDQSNWHARFDGLAIMPLPSKENVKQVTPVLAAYSSINPFNMTKTIVVDGQKEDNGTGIEGIDLDNATYYLRDILPLREESVHEDNVDWDTRFHVLPRTLNVIMVIPGRL